MRRRHQDDLLDLVERIVVYAEDAGEKTVSLNTKAARELLELAKRAPKPRGRPPVEGRERVQENVALHLARSHKKRLIAEGMLKEAAHEKAAEEASAGMLRGRNLSDSTIGRRMEARHRR